MRKGCVAFWCAQGDILARTERNPHNTYPVRWIHPSVMAMLSSKIAGMRTNTLPVCSIQIRIWISAKPTCIAAPPFSNWTPLGPTNLEPELRPCDRTQPPHCPAHSRGIKCCFDSHCCHRAAPAPLTSLGTQCHRLKKSCPLHSSWRNFFTIPADTLIITHWCWFLGIVWTTEMTKAPLSLHKGFIFPAFSFFLFHSFIPGEKGNPFIFTHM